MVTPHATVTLVILVIHVTITYVCLAMSFVGATANVSLIQATIRCQCATVIRVIRENFAPITFVTIRLATIMANVVSIPMMLPVTSALAMQDIQGKIVHQTIV